MRAAFFDLDKTVIAKASIAAFGRPFYRGGLINRRLVARALVSQIIYLHLGASEQKLARVRESMLMLTKGWDRDQIKEIVREALEEIVEPIIYAEALDLIEAHRAAGHKVYLVSASPEEIVQPLAEHLGVDGAIASRAVVDDEGRYTGEMEFYAYGAVQGRGHAGARRPGRDRPRVTRPPTRTPTPTSRCSRPWAIRWPSTPTGCWPRWCGSATGTSCSSPSRSGSATGSSVRNLPFTATAAGVTAAASVGALLAWRLARRPQG